MAKRTSKKVRKDILMVLRDGNEHAYGDIERKANTNWITVRNHCDELRIYDAVSIDKKTNKVKITKKGIKLIDKF